MNPSELIKLAKGKIASGKITIAQVRILRDAIADILSGRNINTARVNILSIK